MNVLALDIHMCDFAPYCGKIERNMVLPQAR